MYASPIFRSLPGHSNQKNVRKYKKILENVEKNENTTKYTKMSKTHKKTYENMKRYTKNIGIYKT